MDNEQMLPPEALKMLRQRVAAQWGGIVLLVVAFGALCLAYDAAGTGVVSMLVAVGLVVGWWFGTARWHESFRWLLTDGTVELRRGVIVQSHSVLPRAQVQNVTVSSGPFARSKGLATVIVHSAGSETPNITIPGVTTDVAESLRADLVPQVPATA